MDCFFETKPNVKTRRVIRRIAQICLIGFVGLSLQNPAVANLATSDSAGSAQVSAQQAVPLAMAQDNLDLEAHGGYSDEYVFAMTKGVMRSTLAPAVKPLALIFTVPLDLVTLPFALVGGLFR
ncbi:MAG: hypothetical protein P8Q97_02270 [Myxococcota bacterium]|jgi:hypothetical protein|nr:hypothetical protein [Myxococcota bacterium]